MTLPNIITGLRILLLPLFIVFLVQAELFSAFLVFIIAGITDALDGFIARHYGQTSQLGAYLDPLADKLLLSSAFLLLTLKNFVPPWVCVLIVLRDIMILIGVALAFLIKKKAIQIGPSKLSKTNTLFQILTVIIVLGQDLHKFPEYFYQSAFWITAFFTVSSGVHYLYEWLKYLGGDEDHP
jgi:cardiolipin synthase